MKSLISVIIYIILIISIVGCHRSSVTPVNENVEMINAVSEAKNADIQNSLNESDSSELSPEKKTQITSAILDGLIHSAVVDLPYQPVMLEYSLNQVLYLMRAGQYDEAAERAQHITPVTSAARFITAKAIILSGKCSSNHPQSDVLQELYEKTKDNDLKSVYAHWLYRAWIDEEKFDKAAVGIDKYSIRNEVDKKQYRELVLIFAKAVIQKSFTEKFDKRLSSWLRIVESEGNGFEAATAIHFRYELALKSGREQESSELARRLVLNYPATQMALWPELYQESLSKLSDSERWQRVQKLIKHFDYENARLELMELVDGHHLTGKTLEDAEWELARISMTNTDNPSLSENIYRKFAGRKGERQEEAVFGIARAKSRQLDYRSAIQALQYYDSKYPKGKHAMRSLYLKGWYWFDLRENEKARPLLKLYAEKTNDTSVWGFYAQTFIRESRWKEAIDAFEKLKNNTNPIVRGKALYWQAYAYHALNEFDKSKNLLQIIHDEFPFTYYDILAFRRESEWFGKDFRTEIQARFKLESEKIDASCHQLLPWGLGCDDSTLLNFEVWRKILLFISHDEVERARQIYQTHEVSLIKQIPDKKREEFKRYATHLVEDYHRAWLDVSGSIRAYSSTYPDRRSAKQQMAYPQAFGPLVEHLSHVYGVPRFFVYGIMLQESRFRPWQVSSADAIGALQMIPKTATKVASELGLEYHPETFFDPKTGFQYSLFYMKKHLTMWHQNLTFTAGSYNGGPHRIGPWMMRDSDKTMDFIVEEFSFDESRHYARKVAEHTLRYLYLYSESASEQFRVLNMLFPEKIIAEEPESGWGY